MKPPRETIQDYLDLVENSNFDLPFEELGIDSFLLMGLRANLEAVFHHQVPDHQWGTFKTLTDVEKHYRKIYKQRLSLFQQNAYAKKPAFKRERQINMPQMAFHGLSENWLLKELGDLHWMMICEGLNVPSHRLTDQLNNRLYASFVRVRWQGSHHLKAFQENDPLVLQGNLSRFGNSIFFSDHIITSAQKQIAASMMTTFSYRAEGNNQTLVRGQPRIAGDNKIEENLTMPPFGEEYSKMRKGETTTLSLAGESFDVTAEVLFETTYTLNPFHDLNGVNLLYFASYPVIHDICEAEYVHRHQGAFVRKHWALEATTLARDIYYYGNCDLDDTLIFKLHCFEAVSGTTFKISSSLSRSSDKKLIAHLFAIKESVTH